MGSPPPCVLQSKILSMSRPLFLYRLLSYVGTDFYFDLGFVSQPLNTACPQWFWNVDAEKFEPREVRCASDSVRQRRLRDLPVCPVDLASRKALTVRTLLFSSHCLQGLSSALVFHCLALCSIDLTSSVRKVEEAHTVRVL